MWLLNLLGSLSLRNESGSVPSAALQRRRLGFLAILGIAGERGISRDRLQAFLWPESPSEKSRHALDQLVYLVRRSFDADPIISEGGDLRLDQSVIATDLAAFDDAMREQRWQDAASLYGGPLVDGFHLSDSRELETWIDAERARVAHQYQDALETLAREAVTRGDRTSAITWWRKLSAADPLSSRIAAQLIKSLAEGGERANAIQYGRAYQKLVRDELEVEPDPAIEKLILHLSRPVDHEHTDSEIRLRPSPQINIQPGTEGPARRAGHGWRTVAIAVVTVGLLGAVAVFQRAPARTVNEPSPAKTYYLRGLNAWNSRSKEGLDTAVVYFRRAIELEPAYGEAYAGLANAYVLLGYSGYRPAEAMFPKARGTALRAIALDSTLAAPYAALGLELTWERRFAEAENAFRKAILLDPKYPTAHQWYGMLLKILGRLDEAVRETGIAAELDPLSLQIQNTYATFLNDAGNPVAALAHYQKVAGEEPDSAWVRRNPWLLTNMAAVYAKNGMFDKALSSARRSVEITSRHPRSITALAAVYAAMGRPDIARQVFSRVDSTNEHYTAERAFFYVDLGDLDSAFLYFDRVEQWPIPILIALGGNKRMAGDPRYHALLEKLGMNPSRTAPPRGK